MCILGSPQGFQRCTMHYYNVAIVADNHDHYHDDCGRGEEERRRGGEEERKSSDGNEHIFARRLEG
jgi:hypothetical protein